MLRTAIIFFFIGLCAYVLGANNVAGLSLEIGRMVLFVFVFLSIISFIASVITGKRTRL
jgi:uncharacterized membrane protein YtjA (UPF0391 family)